MTRHLEFVSYSFLYFLQAMTFTLCTEFANAEVDLSKTIYLENRAAFDESDVIVKDISSGKSASLHVLPMPDQSKTTYGYFRLQLGSNIIKFENLRFSSKGKILFPVISSPNGTGISKVTLFASDEQRQNFAAQLRKMIAMDKQAFERKKQQEAIETKENKKSNEVTSDNSVSAPTNPTNYLLKKSISATKQDEQVALDIETQEAIRRAQLLKEQNALAEKEKIKRNSKAEEIAKEALMHYQNQNYETAAKLFAEATSLDPSNDSYYFQYGVSLYKLSDYRKSLAILNLADADPTHKTELTYFKALNHMKLQEYDSAVEDFKSVVDENDSSLSPTAGFFAGNIAFQKEDLTNARTLLEYSLDHGTDKELDKKAEFILEEIDRIEAFREKQKELFRYSLSSGLSYDQNVLNISTANLATNADAFRFSYGAEFLYRVVYDYRNEFSLDFNLSDIYSVSSSLKADSTIQSADPLVLSAAAPYHRQFNFANKTMTWGLTPTYQTITMSISGASRSQILASLILKNELTFMQTSTLMSNYRIEYTSDKSSLTITSSADDQSGTRIGLGTTQTKLLDQRGTNSYAGSFDYSVNNTNGANYQYTKYVLGAIYSDKFLKDYDGSIKFEYTNQSYANASTVRNDNLYALTGSASKDLIKDLLVSYGLQYNFNSSNVSTYGYNKVLASISLIYSGSKKRK